MTTRGRELDALEALLGQRPRGLVAIGGGDIARSYRAVLADGLPAMVKFNKDGQAPLSIEARMLGDLRQAGLPVPEVYACDDHTLVMAWVDAEPGFGDAAQRAAGRAIGLLHQQPAGSSFGYAYDTPIGSLWQPNEACGSWRTFFAQQRLVARARSAHASGRLPDALLDRVQRTAADIAQWADGDVTPSLVHGDLWGGNMMATAGGPCFIDPAIYHGDGEVDLALATLFGSVGPAFFAGYQEVRPLRPGFFEVRRDLYNLHPLLVHVELFGGSYVESLRRTLDRLA